MYNKGINIILRKEYINMYKKRQIKYKMEVK